MPTPSPIADKAAVAPANKTAFAPADKATVALAKIAVALADNAAAFASEVGLGFSPGNKTRPQMGALAPEVCLPPIPCKAVLDSSYPNASAKTALASRYPKALALGLSIHPQIGALAPGVCLPIPRKTATRSNHRKLILSFALAATLITSCEPPKPIPKTTTDNLQLTTCN